VKGGKVSVHAVQKTTASDLHGQAAGVGEFTVTCDQAYFCQVRFL